MENPNHRELLGEIAQSARKLSERRGQHAAALWSVNDFLTSCDGKLIEHRDSTDLADRGLYLAVCETESGPWMLEVIGEDGSMPAYKADAEVQVAAVRRLPDFLAAYAKRLKDAAGSRMTVSLADQIVEAVATVDTEPTSA